MIDFDQLATSCVNQYEMKNMYEYIFKSSVLFLHDKTCWETFLKLNQLVVLKLQKLKSLRWKGRGGGVWEQKHL